MIQELLHLLPAQVSPAALYALAGLAGVGLGVWLLGARWSRAMITLLLVAAGTILGRALPQVMGWSIDPMGPAIAGALLLGLSGYILHRTWVGLALSALFALWTAAGCWVLFHGEFVIDWTGESMSGPLPEVARATWESVPPELTSVLPWACGTAIVVAGVLAFMWPRVATALLWSGIGLTMTIGCGLAAMKAARPEWLDRLPQQAWPQLALLGGMLLVGTILQARMIRPKKSPAARGDAVEDDSEDSALIGYRAGRA